MRAHLSLALSLVVSLLVASPIQAQAPDVVFRVQSSVGGSQLFAWQPALSSWDTTVDQSVQGLTIVGRSAGTPSGNSITLTASATVSGSLGGLDSATMLSNIPVRVYVKGTGQAQASATTSAQVQANVSDTDSIAEADFDWIPFDNDSIGARAEAPGLVTQSYNETQTITGNNSCGGGGSSIQFTEFPGVWYHALDDFNGFQADSTLFDGAGSAESQATTTITVTFPNDNPNSIADGPYVGGVIKEVPDVGDFVTVKDISYDEDNTHTAGAGICSRQWTIYRPGGLSPLTSSSTNYGFTVTVAGEYRAHLIVTDNEGSTAETDLSFFVSPWLPGKFCPAVSADCTSCSSGSTSGPGNCNLSIQVANGRLQVRCEDPVPTRGYALRNNIYIHTQSRFPNRTTAMGNATFSYGLEVYQGTIRVNGANETHWFLIDGDGHEYDFGPIASAPTAPAGVFSTLAATEDGYELTQAGAPGSLDQAGNFRYLFNASGKLTQITDPNGNIQSITLNAQGNPERVDDLSTNKYLEFDYNLDGLISEVVENNQAAVTHLTYTDGKLTQLRLADSQDVTVREHSFGYNEDGLLSSVTRDNDVNTTATITYEDGGPNMPLANVSYTSGEGSNLNYAKVPGTNARWRTGKTNAQSGEILYDFNSSGDLLKVTNPTMNGASSGAAYSYQYNAARKPTQYSNGTNTYTMTYNSRGKMLTYSNGTGTWTYTYNNDIDLTFPLEGDHCQTLKFRLIRSPLIIAS